jgi:hypothetical protein
MRPDAVVVQLERVRGVAQDRGLLQQRLPRPVGQLASRGVAVDHGRLDRHERRVVAGEVRRVDDDALDDAGHSEPHDRPVDAG